MTIKTKCIIALILLSLVDTVIPFPIIGAILIYVLFQRPPWFKNVIVDIYDPISLDQNQ
jgi:1-acyl-sn-glycerol-3-phosphate acyltransferase